jgi:predicted phosphoribosyltransferase
MYEDRTAAGRVLGEQLVANDVRPDVVLAVPPGGVNVGRSLCDRFDADLGLIVAEPIRTSETHNLPIGAVTDTGVAWIDDDLVEAFGIDEEQLEVEKQRAFREARDKHEIYDTIGDDPTPSGTVAVVDEGLASDTTMKASVSAIAEVEGTYTVAGAPLGIPDVVAELHAVADEVVVDRAVPKSRAIGEFYEQFDRPAVPRTSGE